MSRSVFRPLAALVTVVGSVSALLVNSSAPAFTLPDALHLACAVHAGADAFVTNNRKDFKQAEILEL